MLKEWILNALCHVHTHTHTDGNHVIDVLANLIISQHLGTLNVTLHTLHLYSLVNYASIKLKMKKK